MAPLSARSHEGGPSKMLLLAEPAIVVDPGSRPDFRVAPPFALDSLQSVNPAHLALHGFSATTSVFHDVPPLPALHHLTLVVSVRVAQGSPALSSHVVDLAFGVFPDDGFSDSPDFRPARRTVTREATIGLAAYQHPCSASLATCSAPIPLPVVDCSTSGHLPGLSGALRRLLVCPRPLANHSISTCKQVITEWGGLAYPPTDPTLRPGLRTHLSTVFQVESSLGLHPSEFSLRSCRRVLSDRAFLLAVCPTSRSGCFEDLSLVAGIGPTLRPPACELRTAAFTPERVVHTFARSLLSWSFPPSEDYRGRFRFRLATSPTCFAAGRSPVSLRVSTQLLSWALIAASSHPGPPSRDGLPGQPRATCALQSFRDPVGRPEVFGSTSLGFCPTTAHRGFRRSTLALAGSNLPDRRSPWTRSRSPSEGDLASLFRASASPSKRRRHANVTRAGRVAIVPRFPQKNPQGAPVRTPGWVPIQVVGFAHDHRIATRMGKPISDRRRRSINRFASELASISSNLAGNSRRCPSVDTMRCSPSI